MPLLGMDEIRIHQLELDCIVGIRPDERERAQRVRLDLSLLTDVRKAGRTGRIALSVDYSEVTAELVAMLRFRRYHLIEMAVEELSALLLGLHPVVRGVKLSIAKPGALEGRARAASVHVERKTEDFPRNSQDFEFGCVHRLIETREAGLYLFEVAAGAEIPSQFMNGERYLEWRVGGGLVKNGQPLGGLDDTPAAADPSHPIVNIGKHVAQFFRCVVPPAAEHD